MGGKRFRLWAALLALPLLLAGCGGPSPAPEATVEPASPTPGAEAAEPSPSLDGLESDGALTIEDVSALASSGDGAVRLFAANVGKGDALVLRVGDYLCLIDTGKTWARGRVMQALAAMGANAGGTARLDAVFITHTDDDHTGGLRWMTGGTVENWYASAMFTGVKPEKHAAVKAAEARGQAVRWLQRGDGIPLGDTGAVLKVLAPAHLYTDKDDNNSLVRLLESDQGRMLFTGDMELPEEAELLSFGDDLKCDVLKVANHGDDDTTSDAFARAAAAQIAVVSTDGLEKPGTPDPGVVRRLEAAGSRVAVTEDAGLGLLVTLANGVATAQRVGFGAPEVTGLWIESVDAEDDRITLRNDSGAALDLGGFYLFSDRGEELFALPAGTAVDPGERLVIGTQSTQGACDVLWPDKKVVHRKKTDELRLYDPWGRLVDGMDNGL